MGGVNFSALSRSCDCDKLKSDHRNHGKATSGGLGVGRWQGPREGFLKKRGLPGWDALENMVLQEPHVSVSMREGGNLARILGLLSYYPEVPGTQSAQRADRGPPG